MAADFDIDMEKLAKSRLSNAVSAAEWLSKPGRLLDEINRVHPKLLNVVLHLIDGSGFNVRGDLSLPVGLPYRVGGEEKRYSFTIATANQFNHDYAGVFEEDAALKRRIVVSVDLDEVPPTSHDVAQLLARRRAKSVVKASQPRTVDLIEIYEAIPKVVPFSALGNLFLHYLAGMNICTRTRSGRLVPELKPAICDKCHLGKSSRRLCGKVGGLSEGLLIWVKELSAALAVVRAAEVLERVRKQCLSAEGHGPSIKKLQVLLDTDSGSDELYKKFRRAYLEQFRVTGDDIKAAFVLVAPGHVWIDNGWLKSQVRHEFKPLYVFREISDAGWRSMIRFLDEHQSLAARLVNDHRVSVSDQEELEAFITTEDPAIHSVMSAMRDEEICLRFRGELRSRHNIRAA